MSSTWSWKGPLSTKRMERCLWPQPPPSPNRLARYGSDFRFGECYQADIRRRTGIVTPTAFAPPGSTYRERRIRFDFT